MVWPLARSKGGSNSSVAVLIAVEMKALISAVWAVAVAASMAIMIATMRMTIPPQTQLSYGRKLVTAWRVRRRIVEVVDASTSPAKEGYAVAEADGLQISQPGTCT